MAEASPAIDPRSGFCAATKTFHSLRPPVPFPPESLPISFPAFAFSLLPSPLPSNPALIDAATGRSLSYPQFASQVRTLSLALRSRFRLSKGDVAFVLSPPRLEIPVLYFSLLSLGVVVSPANPISTPSEISRLIHLVKPSIIFATSASAPKLPQDVTTIIIDSAEFGSLVESHKIGSSPDQTPIVEQSDAATVLFSSGTTGQVKGVVLTHRNLIAAAVLGRGAAGMVGMVTAALFHVLGFLCAVKGAAGAETVVLVTERFEVGKVMRAVERFRVNALVLAPPALLKIVREWEGGGGDGLDLSSLVRVSCGGAPIGVELIRRFLKKFPDVILSQGYGLTESTAGIFRAIDPEECRCLGSAGRLLFGCEAKIVNPSTGIALHPCNQGELWIRGPLIMKGYIGYKEATHESLSPEGWLKTGDLCYIDNDGFLFVTDRLKELIKYKGYQVPPAELEHLLQTHPDIIEAAVIPYPDDEVGQIPMAFIVRQPNSTLWEPEIMEFVAKQVAPYKKIRRVSFVKSIPKNATGKILRKELVELAKTRINPKL